MEQSCAVNVVHLKHIAHIGRTLPTQSRDCAAQMPRLAIARSGDTGEPVQKVETCALSLAFANRSRYCPDKLTEKRLVDKAPFLS
jgi:hypothetical protein